MGEINRAYRVFDLNTEEDLRPNTTSRFISSWESDNSYETYDAFKSEYFQPTRFKQNYFVRSNHWKFWKHVYEGTEVCVAEGGDSNVGS